MYAGTKEVVAWDSAMYLIWGWHVVFPVNESQHGIKWVCFITRPGQTRTRTCPPPPPQKKESYLFLTWPPPPSSPRPNPNPNPNLPPSPAQEKKSPTFSQPGHLLRPRRTRTRTRTSTCPCRHRTRTRTRNLYTPTQKNRLTCPGMRK